MGFDINKMIKQTPTPSISYWNNLLNFANDNQHTLTLNELEMLTNECERCRQYWNKDRQEQQTVSKNGKKMDLTIVKNGLNVKKKDVSPNIYKMLEQKKTAAELDELEGITHTAVLA